MRTLLLLNLVLLLNGAFAQVNDDLRLGYDIDNKTWKQLKIVSSSDGNYLAYAYENTSDTLKVIEKYLGKRIKIFDVRAQKFVATISGLSLSYPYLMVFTTKNHLVYVATTFKGLKTTDRFYDYDLRNHETKEIRSLVGGDLMQSVISYSPKHNFILISSQRGSGIGPVYINAYDVGDSLREVYSIKSGGFYYSMDSSGKFIAFNTGNTLKVYGVETGTEVTAYKGALGYDLITFDEHENLVCYSTYDNSIRIEAISQKINRKEYALTELKLRQTDFIELLGDTLLIGGNTGFSVVNIKTGKLLLQSDPDHKGPVIGGTLHTSNLVKLSSNKFLTYSRGNIKNDNHIYYNSGKIYDASTNKIAAFLYADGTDNYCIVARDGRVDGSMEALKKVYWTSRRSTEKTYLERTLDRSFSPKLLNQILFNQTTTNVAFNLDNVISKVPVLALKSFNKTDTENNQLFQSSSKSGSVEISIAENQQEIEEVRLYQNGKLINSISNNGLANYAFDISLTNAFGAENYFFVMATSKSGVESEKIKFTIEYNGATSEDPKLYLLTIGINQYKNPKYNLNYAIADADSVESMIKINSSSLFPHIINYSIRNDRAIKSNIIQALEEIKSKSLEQDVVLVYYAGHGVMSGEESQKRNFYLVPHDVTQLYGRDDLLGEKGISASELKKYSQSINAQKQIFILDACQSAGALESLTVRGAEEEKAIAQLARSTGTFWITSTGTNQFATEFDKLGHGIFTHTLLEGVKGAGDTNKDKKLTIRELNVYIENTVPELAEKLNGQPQYPSAYSFGNDFILMIYK